MNIHTTDINLFEKLRNASLSATQFGSVLYNTNDEFSDIDIHHIYATSNIEMQSFLKSHHHIQYNLFNEDHIFVNLHTFIKNVMNGDSTVLFEILHSGSFINTPLEFIYNMRNNFINYSIIRSYVGLGKRDVDHYHKKKTHREQIKALGHIYRGYYFAKSLMENNFCLINDDFLILFKEIKSISETDYKLKKEYLNNGANLIKELRETLNNKFNNHTLNLPKYMTIENQNKLDLGIKNLINTKEYIYKQNYLNNFDMNIFYNAFENEINYE